MGAEHIADWGVVDEFNRIILTSPTERSFNFYGRDEIEYHKLDGTLWPFEVIDQVRSYMAIGVICKGWREEQHEVKPGI
jgi:hypothetical protein